MPKFCAIGLSSTIQETITFDSVAIGDVNRSKSYRLDASGKAVNAARVLGQIEKGSVSAVCPLGRENAALFLSLAAEDCIPVIPVMTPGKTRYCYTLLESSRGRATELVVSEPVSSAASETRDFKRAADNILEILSGMSVTGAFIMAGSRPAAFPDNLYPRLRSFAASRGVPVMVDFHGKDLLDTIAAGAPEVIKINEREFLSTFEPAHTEMRESDLADSIVRESSRLGSIIIVTRGARRVLAACNGKVYREPVQPVEPVNEIGCGDAFSAGFIHTWTATNDIQRALKSAVTCAAANLVTERPGSIK
ncbi:MAG: hypothetical protein JW875_10275 [Spirochaetales bacterium]|nr:hypothetical protein [Spirochaetales bacterium]